jgi:uncharacterized protein
MSVLVGTDGSLESQVAEALLSKLPAFKREAVDVLAVANPPIFYSGFGMPSAMDAYPEVIDAVQSAAKLEADEAAARLLASGFGPVTAHIQLGSPAEQLIEFATGAGSKLIAIGSHGRGGFVSMLLGSVARSLVSGSPVSVLVGHPKGGSAGGTIENLKRKERLRVLVAVDGSQGSRAAIEAVGAQGKGAFEQIVVACVDPVLLLPPGVDASAFDAIFDQGRTQAESIMMAAQKLLIDGAGTVSGVTVTGRPSEELVKLAKERDVDVIAIGATRHSALSRVLLGSVSFEVASSAPCGVWIVRP